MDEFLKMYLLSNYCIIIKESNELLKFNYFIFLILNKVNVML